MHFLLIFIGAMAGLVYSSTLAGQLLFFEITGGCSWALISYYQTPKAQAAAMKALIITHVGAIGLYIAAAYLFSQSGTFSITALEHLDPSAKNHRVIRCDVCCVGVNQRNYQCKFGCRMRWKHQHR